MLLSTIWWIGKRAHIYDDGSFSSDLYWFIELCSKVSTWPRICNTGSIWSLVTNRLVRQLSKLWMSFILRYVYFILFYFYICMLLRCFCVCCELILDLCESFIDCFFFNLYSVFLISFRLIIEIDYVLVLFFRFDSYSFLWVDICLCRMYQ